MELNHASVLLVEDEPFLREAMGAWLKRAVERVLFARDGAEALLTLAANKVHLILSDVRMPVMDGMALLKKVNEAQPPKPCVILLTGFSDLSVRQAYDLGAEAILEKPIRREELVQVMQNSLAAPDELWRRPPGPAPGAQLKVSFPSLAAALEQKRIAFGRRGFSIESSGGLREGPVRFAVNFPGDGRILSGEGVVRWIAPREECAGIEITHIDDASRPWIVDLVKRSDPVAFIPASTGAQPVSRLDAA